MASSAAKRVKEHQDSFSQSQSCQESITSPVPELPVEIIQHILEMGGSLKLVKNCRLVSKSWNEISCTVLKKLSAVSMDEDDEERLEQFKDFLLGRQLGVSPELPNPFQYYNISTRPGFPASINKFIQYPNVWINALNVTLYWTISAIQFRKLLGLCKPFLRHLSIIGCCEDSNLLVHPELTTGWSSLTGLAFDDYNSSVPKNFIKFIQALIQGNPSLQQLSLDAVLDNVKNCLVSKSNTKVMASLRSLSVWIRSMSRDPALSTACIKEISALEAPNLKEIKFKVNDCHQSREDFQEAALTLIKRNSHSLKSLKTKLDLHRIPALPLLEKLSCYFSQSDRFEYVNAKNFPSLTALKVRLCFRDILEFCSTQDTEPHALLNSLDVQYTEGSEFSGPTAIWPILGRHFPNVTNISISFRSQDFIDYTHNVLVAIGKWFPQLESLEFGSSTPITLFEIKDIEIFSEKGWALQDVANDPILGLKNLVSLNLKDRVMLARAFIRFGLPQMKNWRSLCFPWDEQRLIPDDIPQYLGFLTNIGSIVITETSLSRLTELRKLAEETSNVSLRLVE